MSSNESANFRESRAALISSAKNILERKEAASPEVMYRLAKRLKNVREFGYARKLLARARRTIINDPVLGVKLRQEYALCTYKDWNLPLDERLDRALEILGDDEEENLKTTRNQVTLGLAGNIYKRKWEASSQKQFLERALSYYLRGYKEDPAYDFGYTGTCAAFVLDLLASLESAEADSAQAKSGSAAWDTATARRAQAREIRQNLTSVLTAMLDQDGREWLKDDWWIYAAIAEAYFGLSDYDKAREWLVKARELKPEGWQYESMARQLSHMALLQSEAGAADSQARAGVRQAASLAELENSPAWSVLKDFFGETDAGVRSFIIGKVGLALAGGGVRAALFHIGVLAKLAELDMLRNVEVLSCSSGGSIVGAHYYLEVRHLLQSKRDEEITREDYIKLVQRLERDFLAGVQRNIRMRGIASLAVGLKSVFKPNYSRSERIGDLFESEIYSKVTDGDERALRYLNDLYVHPLGAPQDFTPKRDNWQRAAKVPILVLNATTLNTGHNWQFTASWMGETPTTISTETDANDYLRPMYYDEAPARYAKMRLGQAVAASACIPGLFDPITLAGLYPDMTVRLADGGVHGDQGVTALLEQDCEVLLVCDASGEAETQSQPGSGFMEVPTRSANILLARVRALQYDDLKARQQAKAIRALMYVHLMKDLDGRPISSIPGNESKDIDDDARPSVRRGPLTRYGIRKDVQASLASVRTDLDSFSDVEAFALMTSAYRMTEYEFASCVGDFSEARKSSRPRWRFLTIEEPMKRSGSVESIYGTLQLLRVASNRGFKVWRLSRLAQVAIILLGLLATGLLSYFAYKFWPVSLTVLTVGKLLSLVIAICAILLIGKIILVVKRSPKTLTDIAVDIILALSGFLAARIYLGIFDPLYLRLGAVRNVIQDQFAVAPAEPELPLTVKGAFTQTIAAMQNVGSKIQQSAPVRAVGEFIDQKILDQSDPTTNKFTDRNLVVEAVGKLLETGGYEVIRFPRAHNLNPLNVNLDLIASKNTREGDRYFCIEVKEKTEDLAPVDWKYALELDVASKALKMESEKHYLENPDQGLSGQFGARLVLVDATPDSTLTSFVEGGDVKLVSYTGEQIVQIYYKASKLLNIASAPESEKSDGASEHEESESERDKLREELRPLLESLTGVEETLAWGEEGTLQSSIA